MMKWKKLNNIYNKKQNKHEFLGIIKIIFLIFK